MRSEIIRVINIGQSCDLFTNASVITAENLALESLFSNKVDNGKFIVKRNHYKDDNTLICLKYSDCSFTGCFEVLFEEAWSKFHFVWFVCLF